MNPESKVFKEELDYFRRDVEAGLQSLYAYLAIHKIASQRSTIQNAINRTPLLWNTILAALQDTQIITLGRIFDKSTAHNAYSLIEYASAHPSIFSRESLRERKAPDPANQPPWVQGYIEKAYVPRPSDFTRLSALLDKRSDVYLKKFRAIRSKVVAHKVIADHKQIEKLYSRAKFDEIIDIYIFLHRLYECLWELLVNGHKPVLRPQPRSVAKMQSTKKVLWSPGRVQERIVRETQTLLESMIDNQPNNH